MTITKTTFAAAVAATLLTTPVFAQDAAFKLPEQCTAAKASGGMVQTAMADGDAQAKPANGRTSTQVLLISPSEPTIWNSGMNSSDGGTR